MNIGTLTIEMAANVARIRTDMDAAKSTVNGAMESIKNAAGMAAKALGAIGVGLSVGAAVKGLYDLTIDAMKAQAALKGLSETTGATVEWLSSIRVVAKLAGTDMEAISGGLTKLAKNIETGSSEANKGLRAIGLSSKELQGLNTDQQFDKIAKALDGYADGAGKTAAAQLILGKSGAALLPFIKDYVEYGDLAVKTTAEQAKQADDLEKSIRGLTLAKEAWKTVVGTALVPVLGDVVKVLFKMQTETGGVNAEAKRLAGDGSIRKWAESAVIGVAYLVDILQGLWGLFKFVGAGIAGILASSMTIVSSLGEALVAIIKGNYSEIPGIVKGAVGAVQTIVLAAREDMKAGLFPDLMSDKFKKQFAESAASVGDAAAAAKPKIKGLSDTQTEAAKTAKELADAYASLLAKVNERYTQESALAATGEKLTDGQKFSLGILKELTSAKHTYTEEQKIAITQALEEMLRIEALNKKTEEHKKQLEELAKVQAAQMAAEAQLIAASAEKTQALNEENQKLQEQITTFGMTERAINALNIARLQAKLVIYEAAKATGFLTDQDAKAAEEIKKQIELLRERDGLMEKTDSLKAQQEAWGELGKTVEGFFTDLFQNGRSAFSNLWSTIKSFFAQVAAKFATKFIFDAVMNVSGGGGGLGGLLSSVLGGSGGAGGGILSGIFGGAGAFGASASGAFSNVLGSLFGTGGGIMEALGSTIAGVSGGLSGIMGGSVLSGLGQMLGALGPIGAVIAGITALVSIFAKDEKGIKFDNSLTSAGNPQNIQTSALGNFAPSGDVDAKMLSAFMPLFDKVKAFDDYLAKNLLSDETLATVQGQIQDLKNPRWWNLEDKDAIEKASKYFLQQRYSTAFDSINKSVADTIRTFSGTADELLTFIQGFIVMTETVKAVQAAAKEAAADTADTVAAIMEEQSNNVLYAYRAQLKASKDLLNIAPDGADALGAVVTGMQSLRSAAVQLAVQITQVKAAIDSMFSDSIRSISMSTMTKEEQYKFLQDESAQLYMKALTATDPMEVQRLAEKINADVMAAWNLLTPEQQAAAKDEQIRRLQEVNAALDARVTTLGNEQQDEYIARMDQLSKKLDEVVVAQLDAAAKQNNAADKQLDAANTPKTVDVSLTINRTGDITNAEVGG